MKTFEEAFAEISKVSSEEIIRDWKNLLEDDNWRYFILGCGYRLYKDGSKCETEGDALALICASLHSVFAIGLITGIKMEKEEKKF